MGDGVVRGDRKRLSQVLVNLMSNAAKFSPKGEQVEIRAGRENGSFRVAVIDKGPGIPEEFQGRIFERFAQEDWGVKGFRPKIGDTLPEGYKLTRDGKVRTVGSGQ